MSQLIIVLSIAIVCVIFLLIWNSINFHALKKMSSNGAKELNDAKYWELKYKYEFLIAIVAVISASAGFLGYSSLTTIELAIKQDFKNKVDSISIVMDKTYNNVNERLISANDSVGLLNKTVDATRLIILRNAKKLSSIKNEQTDIIRSGFQSKVSLTNLSKQIDSINTNNKIQREFYLVPNLEFTGETIVKAEHFKIKFEDLKTITGDKLPKFKSPPIVLSAMSNYAKFDFMSITTESMEVLVTIFGGVPYDDNLKTAKFYGSFIFYPTN